MVGHPAAIMGDSWTSIVWFTRMILPTHFLSAVWIFSLQLQKQWNMDADKLQELLFLDFFLVKEELLNTIGLTMM